jgi:spore coat protein H
LDEFARFMAVTVWLSTMDSILGLGQNFYVYLSPVTQKLQFIPWDLDHSFGQFPMRGSQEQREQLSIRHPWQGSNRLLERVFQVDAFNRLYLGHLQEFSRTLFLPERFDQQVDSLAAVLRPAVQAESSDKLERFEKAVSGKPIEPVGFGGPGGGGPGPRFGGFSQVKPVKGFVKIRAESVQDQLAGKSNGAVLEEFGGGPRDGRGGPGRRGGPGGFGPGNFLGDTFMAALDTNKDQAITRDEFVTGFAQWFGRWNIDRSGLLSEEQLRNGINQDLAPMGRFGPPDRPGPRPE